MILLSAVSPPVDGIRLRQPKTTVYVNSDDLGEGTLYIAESHLSWISNSGNGFSIEYPRISLHAICRDLTAFPHPCLFLMLDIGKDDEEEICKSDEDNDGNESDCDEQEAVELRLVPEDKGMLDAMFYAMNACQALHPDPQDSSSEDDFMDHDDLELPLDETDSQFANLRIRAREVDMADRVVGRAVGREVDRVVGREVDRVVGRAVDRDSDRFGVGMVPGDRSFFQECVSGQNWMEGIQSLSHNDLLGNYDDEEN